MTEAEKVARAFMASWSSRDLDTIMGFFAPDAVYHNIPLAPLNGAKEIAETIAGFLTIFETVEFEVLNLAVNGHVVMTERVDHFTIAGKPASLPVSGTIEIRDGKVQAFRDYFDVGMFEKATGLGM